MELKLPRVSLIYTVEITWALAGTRWSFYEVLLLYQGPLYSCPSINLYILVKVFPSNSSQIDGFLWNQTLKVDRSSLK